MAIDLTNSQAFDDYAARFGWTYDNGGYYHDLDWDWYASNAHRWDLLPDGTVRQTVVIMRRGETTVAAVHFEDKESTQIWSGHVPTSVEFDRLLESVAHYMESLGPGGGVSSAPVAEGVASAPTYRPAGDVLREVWGNLSGLQTWWEVAGWSILCATTFIPVMVLWGANRLNADDPLVPMFLAISIAGGAVGMCLCYPRKGYWPAGMIAGPLFGPGIFLAFWLLAGKVMNRLILLGLTALGAAPSYVLFVFLLCRKARKLRSAEARGSAQ